MVTIADFKKFVDGLLKPVTTKIGNVEMRVSKHYFHQTVMKYFCIGIFRGWVKACRESSY